MSYLSDIVSGIRNMQGVSFRDSVYMGNDINAIDTAYSDTENHKLSVFFVPGDTTISDGEVGRMVETNYFYAYIFCPVEDDVGATDGWEVARDASSVLVNGLSLLSGIGVNKIRYLSSREFRVGRGYYIYVLSLSVDTLPTSSVGGQTVYYFKHTGELDGRATYTTTTYENCIIDANFALSRSINGIYRAFGCEVLLPGVEIRPTYKDWFIIDGDIQSIGSKSDAIAAGHKVYEVNEWKTYRGNDGGDIIGTRIIGA